jgi:capsid protein
LPKKLRKRRTQNAETRLQAVAQQQTTLAHHAQQPQQPGLVAIQQPRSQFAPAAASKANTAGKKKGMLAKLQQRLAGSKFRWLNEQLYTTSGDAAFALLQGQQELFEHYHQVSAGVLCKLQAVFCFMLAAVHMVVAVVVFCSCRPCGVGQLALLCWWPSCVTTSTGHW